MRIVRAGQRGATRDRWMYGGPQPRDDLAMKAAGQGTHREREKEKEIYR